MGAAYFEDHGAETYEGHCMVIAPVLVSPKARGQVWLRSSDPTAKPRIITNTLSEPEDLESMIAGMQHPAYVRGAAAGRGEVRVAGRVLVSARAGNQGATLLRAGGPVQRPRLHGELRGIERGRAGGGFGPRGRRGRPGRCGRGRRRQIGRGR